MPSFYNNTSNYSYISIPSLYSFFFTRSYRHNIKFMLLSLIKRQNIYLLQEIFWFYYVLVMVDAREARKISRYYLMNHNFCKDLKIC